MSGMTRHALILAAVAGALTLGACGSGKDNNATGSAGGKDKAFDGALKFAKCMREHGVDFPDPVQEGAGRIRLGGPGSKNRMKLDDPKMKTAQDACQKYLQSGGGPPMDPATKAKMQDAFVAYAGCMRGKGINMPDPKVDGRGVGFKVTGGGKGGISPDSPVFQAADKSCHRFLAGIDAIMKKGRSK
jgi:hypothetical protein